MRENAMLISTKHTLGMSFFNFSAAPMREKAMRPSINNKSNSKNWPFCLRRLQFHLLIYVRLIVRCLMSGK